MTQTDTSISLTPPRERHRITTLINAAIAILDKEQPMTIRQLFYRLVSAGMVPNDQGHYQLVSRVMTKAREDGRVPFNYIVDRSRPAYEPFVFDNAAGYAEFVKKSYHKDYWKMQPNHVELWTEKDAIIGSIEAVTDELGITVRVQRGFVSTTRTHEIAAYFNTIYKPIHVFYLGDHDPSGQCIETDAEDRIRAYSKRDFSVLRLAIHKADIATFNLPPLRIKASDSRARGFKAKFGSECVELDALPPDVLRDRVKGAVESLIDLDLWNRAIAVEKVELRSIVETVGRWDGSSPRASAGE